MRDMRKFVLRSLIAVSAVALVACETSENSITDGGLDGGPLEDKLANIWVSPDGCQYWYIDDGLEGYMAARLNRDGTPVCTQAVDRSGVISKDGSPIVMEQEPSR